MNGAITVLSVYAFLVWTATNQKFTYTSLLSYCGRYAKVYRTMLAYGGRAGKASRVLSLGI